MNQNPIHDQGFRNVFCPFYRHCLDHAAKCYWECWSCLECQHQHKQSSVTDIMLSREGDYPYYSISPSLYEKVEKFSL